MVYSKFFRHAMALLFMAGLVFGVTSCKNDDVDAMRKTQSYEIPDEGERIENKVVKGSLTHDWDVILDDDKTSDNMDALLTVTTYVNGEIEGEPMKFGRHPQLNGGIFLEKENYNITAEQVENHILTQELRRHYVKNAQTGFWEELDTLVAKTQDNTVYVPVMATRLCRSHRIQSPTFVWYRLRTFRQARLAPPVKLISRPFIRHCIRLPSAL